MAYKYKGEDISKEFVVEGFENSSFTILDDYISNTDGLETVEEKVGKTSDVAAKDAVVTSSPGQASENTELEQVDTSSELEDPDPSERDLLVFNIQETERQIKNYIDKGGEVNESDAKVLQGYKDKLATIDSGEVRKQDKLKAEAITVTNEIEGRIKNIPKEDILNIQANDYFGPVKNRNDRTTTSRTVPGMMGPTASFEPTFESDESYTKYLKETLGNKYNQYLDYKKTNEIVPFDVKNESQLNTIYNEAETKAKDKVYNNSLFNVSEDVQEYMVASPNFASGAESLEAQKFLIKEQKDTVNKNYKTYDIAKKEWESEALPLQKEAKEIKSQIDKFKFYSTGASQEQADQYNNLIQTYNSKIQKWEEKGFNELPVFLNSQAKLVNSQQKDYSKMLDDSRKALVSADLFEKNLKQDYSASARVGRVFDEFFVQSTRNFLDLTAELVLRAAPVFQPLAFLTSPEYSGEVDSLIETIQKNNKNYNLNMASKRENIPTSPSIDDIGKDGLSVWDWTSIAFQDNSATIATTLVPGLTQLKGAAGVSKAFKTASYTARKTALQNQKKLWLAGKKTVQGTFFVAETGGKYGELQTDEASREEEIKLLYSKLDNIEDLDEKTEIYSKIKELEEVEEYSLLQKAFTSYSAGATATLFETLGTLKMLEPAKNLAKQIGVKAAKKELYKQPVRFAANLTGATLAGLKSMPKNITGEIIEETLTEVSHNALDITVLGENKSMFEGINKDFLASTGLSSIGIMAPRSAGNLFNIVKSEFRTKSEIFNNQKLARELIDLNESTTLKNSKQLRGRKRQILKELALSDAISLHKLRYMTADQIEEVADINRQMRQVNGKFRQLGSLGDLGEAENKRVKKQLDDEYSNLTTARQEILDAKQRSNTKKAASMNEALSAAARNSNSEFWYGINDFYNDVTMTQMGDGDFISIKSEITEDGIKYEDLDNQLAKFKGKTVRVPNDETGKEDVVDAFEFLKESIENNEFNATKLFGDIIVNQAVIDLQIHSSPTEASSQYAAIAPLEELFHLSIAQKDIKFDSTAKNAVLEAEKVLKEKRDLGVISEKDYNSLNERFSYYKSSDGKNFNAEEFIAQMNNAVFLGAINRSDLESTPSFKKFLNNTIRSTFGDMSWMLSLENSDDVFNLIKNFKTDVSKGVIFQAPGEDEEIKQSKVNKELGNEIKALVPEGTTKRRYDSRVIGDVYAKLVQGTTLDGLINGQLNKFGVVGDNVYGKPKDVFLEDVKAQLYEKSLTRFNPESNDDLGGFVVNELIRYRIGDVVNRYKKEAGVSGKSLDVAAGEAGSVQEIADDSVSIEEQIDVADTVSKEDSKLTKATKILSKEQYNEASEIIKEKIKDIDPKNLSYKKVGGFITDILSYITSVPADKILDSTKNLSQGQVTTAAMFIEKNIDYIRRTLPEGAVLGAATEKLMGTSTGVANSVLKKLYDKNPRIKKGQGLSPWTLKKGLTNNDILEAIGRPKGVEPKPISPRSPEGQVIKGILNIVDKNITNELVRTVESDLTLEQKQDVSAGKSELMFSKSFNLGLENGSNTENILSVLFSKSARKNYEQILKAKRPELKDIPEQVDNLIKWADSLDIKDNKKAKYKKLGLFYMANGYAIFPEDGYKIEESIRLSAINKIDPYAFKNPNELIEKYEKTTKIAKINPDSVKEFSNKEEIAGLTIYDVEDSRKGQEAVRRIVDSNWGKKSNPWCLIARTSGYISSEEVYSQQEIEEVTAREKELGNTVTLEGEYMYEGEKVYELTITAPKSAGDLGGSFSLWKSYNEQGNGFKIAFNNGKLNSFRDGNDMQWWDRMDKPQKGPALKIKADANGLVAEGYIDLKSSEQVIEGYKKDYKEGDLTIEESYTKDKKLEYKNTYGKNKFSDKSLIAEYFFDRIDGNDYVESETTYGDDNSEIIKTTRNFDSPGNKLHKKTLRKRYYDKNTNIIDEVKEKDILTGVITEEIIFTDNNTGYGTFDVYKAETINGKKKVSIDERKRFLNNDKVFSKGVAIEKSLVAGFIAEKYNGVLPIKQEKKFYSITKELLEYGGVNGVFNFDNAVELGDYTKDELELINYVFEGNDWLFGIFQNDQEQNQGIKLEKLVKVAIKNLKLKDVSLDLSEGGFSSGVDIVLSVKDKKLNIELKLNKEARMGSFTIKRNGDTFSYTKGAEGIETKLKKVHKAIQDALTGNDYKKAWKKYTEEGVKFGKKLFNEGKTNIQTYVNTETGQLIGAREVFNYLKDEGFQKALTISLTEIDGKPINQEIIELLYNNKDIYDINIGGEGMFSLGESTKEKPYKKLEANVVINIVTSRARSESKSGVAYRSIQRATPFISSISSNSDIDITNLNNIEDNISKLVDSMSGKVYSKTSNLNKAFNDILENKSGIPSEKRYGIVEAITKGSSKGRFNFFIPPSAEDFIGLLYPTLGKGELGDAQMSWYKKNLIDPYAEAMNKLSKSRIYLMNTYKSLKKQLDVVPKDLAKKIKGTDYTREQAVRVYIWNKQKMNIPGISDADVNKLVSYVADDVNLQQFGNQLINMQTGDGYIKPKESWPAGTITTDILEGLNTTKRAKYLQTWQENVDVIFSEENLNKLQAMYGLNYRKALENMLKRMKSGRNRSFPGDSTTGRVTDWLTGSVGTIMFLNTRSAVLQTISAINFVNFTDNNVLAAGKAFANQKQYWADFMKLMNSDFLKERRGGLRINVNEADIADMAKKGGAKGAISKLLELGFAPTQIADSFAIASGGSAFYRNRINTYLKQKDANGNNVYTEKQAEKKAFEDFRETAEESQQSSRADRISMQQASPLGRVVLAFANTPAQYARIIKKAASDLKNGRGDRKENISKIIYYGFAQNLIFNALQQALFAVGFGDEETEDEEKEKKYVNIANGMLDSILRGSGIGGAIVSVGKNAVIKIVKELEKDRPKLQNIAAEVLKISPPISAKYSRLVQAGKSYDWNKDQMREKGLSLDNPALLAGGNVLSALTNIPLDRAIKKANNVVAATSQDLETWERLALLGGWQQWEIGIKEEKKKKKKGRLKSNKLKSNKLKTKKLDL